MNQRVSRWPVRRRRASHPPRPSWLGHRPSMRVLGVATILALAAGTAELVVTSTEAVAADNVPPQPPPPGYYGFYNCNGGLPEYYAVPESAESVVIEAWGAQGANAVLGHSGPGPGAAARATVDVSRGERLEVTAGCTPTPTW